MQTVTNNRNLLELVFCPHCGARGRLRQSLTMTIRREAEVVWLAEYGVEEIDTTTADYFPVDDGSDEEQFFCAECGYSFGGLYSLLEQTKEVSP